jgi:DNA gyrase inhibitor GyrI
MVPLTGRLVIEFPLPEKLDVKILPGGHYAILKVEKVPSKIRSAIRTFRGDYLPFGT